MEITYKQYRIMPCENAPGVFDLNIITPRKKKETGEDYESYNNVGYGMQLESCIKRIIHLELNKDNSVLSLSKYIKAYKEVSDEVVAEIKSQTNIKQ